MNIIAPAIKKEQIYYPTTKEATIDGIYKSLLIRADKCVVHLCGCPGGSGANLCCKTKREQ
jgi:hypothetical protein